MKSEQFESNARSQRWLSTVVGATGTAIWVTDNHSNPAGWVVGLAAVGGGVLGWLLGG
ncbi:MAG: hypothetical protein J7641_19205 [Cyanobacteria bacterium SID2]|nr:hypothetical protein [Cyanobacteria bacterium SID2]MBP0004028.1 hypothetical protein [Cyanobacteria bacterium SBC]